MSKYAFWKQNENKEPAVDLLGKTELHHEASTGNIKQIRAFLQAWPHHVDKQDCYGRTALHIAARWGFISIVKALLDEGQADVNITNNTGLTPLHLAVRNGHLGVVKLLISPKNNSIDSRTLEGDTALHIAAVWGFISTVKVLLDEGQADVNVTNNTGLTPLHLAVRNGRLGVVKLLVSPKNNTIYSRTLDGDTVLHIAAVLGFDSIVEFLLTEGQADVNSINNTGWTPLHKSVYGQHLQIVKLLLGPRNNTVDARNEDGDTALHFAVRCETVSILELLLNEGQADITVTDNIGRTPLHMAVRWGHFNSFKLLATQKNNTIECQDKLGETPLHIAAKYGHDDIAEALLDASNKISNIKDINYQTPAHKAAMMGHVGILKLLHDRSPLNLYEKTSTGQTIIDFAMTNDNTFDFCINMDDKYGITFLQHLAIQDQIELFKKLMIYHNDKVRFKRIFPKDDFNSRNAIKGRNKELRNIKNNLRKNKILSVTGFSGIGKTALVKSYAWRNKKMYNSNLFWIDCQNQESIKYSFTKIAKYLKISTKKYDNHRDYKAIVKDIFNIFKFTTGLLVFDNVDSREEIDEYLVKGIEMHIIIITKEINLWENINCLNLLPIAKKAALEIFEPLFKYSLLQESERSNIATLTNILQGIPLALHIAKMYIMHEAYIQESFDLSVCLKTIADEINNKQIYCKELVKNEFDKILYSLVNLNFKKYKYSLKLYISCSYLNPCFISYECLLKLMFFQYKDIFYKNSVLTMYIRSLIFNLNNNQVITKTYATNLALFYAKIEPNCEENCYKTVLNLVLQDFPSIVNFYISENLYKLLTNEFLQHHRTVFSYAKKFNLTIKQYISEELFPNLVINSKIKKEYNILGKLLQYLTKNGCTENLLSIFTDLDRKEINKLIEKFKLLHSAVESGDISTVNLVYQYDNNLQKRNDFGHTMIWVAIQGNHTEILEFLLSKGVLLEDTDRLNKTPLHRAAFLGRNDIVKFLLEKGVDPNIRNRFHRAPLHYAAMEGYNDVIIELLNHKDIDINARDHYRRSPIFETVRCFQLDSLRLFIERGAKVITKDFLDMSPYRLAKRQRNRVQLLEVFREYGYTEESIVDEKKWVICNIRIV